MKRYIKNLLMILLVLGLCGSMFFTINYIKKNNNINGDSFNQNMEKIPELPEGSNEEGTPPSENDNQTEVPEKPSNKSNAPSENEEILDIPNMPNNNENNGEMPQPINNNASGLSIIYYLVFAVQNLILASLIIYLIVSKFNKLTFKETVKCNYKLIISLLLIITLTVGFTYLDSMLCTSNQPKENLPANENNEISYSAANEITESTTLTSGDFTSDTTDENVILVSGKINTNISNITVQKTGDSDGGDNTSFYGINSAIIAKNGANLTLENITISTSATGANGVFSYGGSATTNNSSSDGTTITIKNSTITTTKDNSGGIMTTGGGITNAYNLTINTSGISSAAIRTDRGGGSVLVEEGTYTTSGQGSPAIYSTADITVKNATLISKLSEGIVIEGKNKVLIENCNLTDNNTKLNGQSTTYKNIFLYQSMSGDAASGNSEFTANNSNITTNNGDTFYITNTTSTINLNNNTIVNNDSNGNFLRAQSDSWGNQGENGGVVELNLTSQNVSGNIVIDTISTLKMTMTSNSYYEGTINGDNTAQEINIILDQTSKIKLTGDSYITSLDNADTSNGNIDFNGYKLYVNGQSING
jgi:hypothetical protein